MSFGRHRKTQDRANRDFPFRWVTILATRPAFNALVGTTSRRPFGGGSTGEVVTVVWQRSWWLSEGGLRMGLDLDQGWVVELAARLASETERAVFAAAEAKARLQRGEPA